MLSTTATTIVTKQVKSSREVRATFTKLSNPCYTETTYLGLRTFLQTTTGYINLTCMKDTPMLRGKTYKSIDQWKWSSVSVQELREIKRNWMRKEGKSSEECEALWPELEILYSRPATVKDVIDTAIVEPVKRGRGRPKKVATMKVGENIPVEFNAHISKSYIKSLPCVFELSELYELLIQEHGDSKCTRKDNKSFEYSGTYVHPDLAPILAMYMYPSISRAVCDIVNQYQQYLREYSLIMEKISSEALRVKAETETQSVKVMLLESDRKFNQLLAEERARAAEERARADEREKELKNRLEIVLANQNQAVIEQRRIEEKDDMHHAESIALQEAHSRAMEQLKEGHRLASERQMEEISRLTGEVSTSTKVINDMKHSLNEHTQVIDRLFHVADDIRDRLATTSEDRVIEPIDEGKKQHLWIYLFAPRNSPTGDGSRYYHVIRAQRNNQPVLLQHARSTYFKTNGYFCQAQQFYPLNGEMNDCPNAVVLWVKIREQLEREYKIAVFGTNKTDFTLINPYSEVELARECKDVFDQRLDLYNTAPPVTRN
jgi:hypothetical protein